MSDDNPICDEPLVTSSVEGRHFDDDDDETKHEEEDVDDEDGGQNGRGGRGQNGGRCADEATAAIDALTLTKQDFLVSFMVDARGGSMKGCRYSGVKSVASRKVSLNQPQLSVIIPPKTAPQPMRITCRYIRENALLHPPNLNEGEGLACRILQVGPRGSKFLGPVLIEVPHVASLRDGDREVVVLRCDSASKGNWTEHVQEQLDDKTLKELVDDNSDNSASSATPTTSSSPIPGLNPGSRPGSRLNHHQQQQSPFHQSSHRSNSPIPELVEKPRNVVHIVTKDFPQYFALVSRPRQEIATVGPEGAILISSRFSKAQVYHKPKSLVKRVNVGLSVQPIEDEMVEEIMVQGGSVSPIVTIEPRRRKFHKAITVSVPLPERISSAYLRKKQEINKNDRTIAPKKMPIGANDVTVNPNKKSSATSGLLPPSPKHSVNSDDIEMSLRLICSMSGNRSKAFWEDVTDNTPMTVVLNQRAGIENKHQLDRADVGQDTATAFDLRNLEPVLHLEEDRSPGSVQFTSLVSASFWLVYCPNWMSLDVISLVDHIYKNAIKVPYFCRFHVYARSDWFARVSNNVENHTTKSTNEKTTAAAAAAAKKPAAANNPAHVRILCLTDPARAVNPLELQEDFTEIARSDVVEVRDKSDIDVQFGGNLFKSQRNNDEASDEFEYEQTHKLIFHPFSDNRQGFSVKRRNENNPYGKGSIAFCVNGIDRPLFEAKIDLSKFM